MFPSSCNFFMRHYNQRRIGEQRGRQRATRYNLPLTTKGNAMKIAKNTVVTVNYKLSDAQNNLIEEGSQPMVYLHGGYENTLPKIEEELDGKEVGYASTLQVEPDDAFGDYDAELVKVEDRKLLPEPLEVGMQFEGMADGADDEPMIFTV